METGDLVFVRNNTWIAKMIRFFDKGRYSHVAIAVSNDRIAEAQYNIRLKSSTPLTYEYYEVVEMNLSEEQKEKLLLAIDKHKGKRYDYLLVFSMATKWLRVDNPNYMICTELVLDVLKEIGVVDPYIIDMKPNELYKYITEKNSNYRSISC